MYDDNNTAHVLQRTETPIYAASRIGSYYHAEDNTDHYRYELTDHLGTVRATFSPDPVTPAVPKVESYADYYPYGLVLRSAMAEPYRFGYQGQYAEFDPETGTNHFELREYDPVIGRWFGPDPYQEFYSSYVGMGNNPVSLTDPNGGSTGGGDPEPTVVHVDDPGLVIHEPEFVLNGSNNKSYWDQVFWYGNNQVRWANDPQYSAFREGGALAADMVGAVMMVEGVMTLGMEGFMYLSARSAANSSINAGGRVFWSGGDPAKNAAMDFAKSNGMKTLEMTTRGRIMNKVSPYLPRSITNPIWKNLSRNFAKGAKGEVNFFTPITGPRPTSIWKTVEEPILNRSGAKIITHTF